MSSRADEITRRMVEIQEVAVEDVTSRESSLPPVPRFYTGVATLAPLVSGQRSADGKESRMDDQARQIPLAASEQSGLAGKWELPTQTMNAVLRGKWGPSDPNDTTLLIFGDLGTWPDFTLALVAPSLFPNLEKLTVGRRYQLEFRGVLDNVTVGESDDE